MYFSATFQCKDLIRYILEVHSGKFIINCKKRTGLAAILYRMFNSILQNYLM